MSAGACLVCGAPCDGRLRVALWEEEEKGRLVAKSVALCAACHASFLAGTLSRVEIARRYHAQNDYRPAEWIVRIDRDALLDVSCLACGVLLPVGDAPVEPVRCARCGALNHFADREGPSGRVRLTASLESSPA